MATSKPKRYIFQSVFPTPGYLSLNPVAIDITPSAIYLMQLEKKKKGLIPKVYKELNFESPKDLMDSKDNEKDASDIVTALKKLKKEFKLKYVVSSLPEEKTFIFRETFPREALADIASAIRFKLEENVPLKAGDVNFDYAILDYTDQSQHIDVVVSVFPKSVIKFYTDLFNRAGLIPIGFQSEATSLARSLVPVGDKRPYLIIRLMENVVNSAIIEDEAVQYTFGIDVNLKNVLESENNPDASQLKESLNKLLIYWFTSKNLPASHKKIEDVVLIGEYAGSEKIVNFLEKNLKINVFLGNVWTNNFSTDVYIPKMSKTDSMKYATVVGLAQKAIGV